MPPSERPRGKVPLLEAETPGAGRVHAGRPGGRPGLEGAVRSTAATVCGYKQSREGKPQLLFPLEYSVLE